VAGPLPDLVLGFAVSLKPDPTALPGTSLGQKAVNGLVALVMIAVVLAGLVGLAQWAWSSSNNNPHGASAGKKRVALCVAVFFAVGAGTAILDFATKMGEQVK
jgi:hypothetical protein